MQLYNFDDIYKKFKDSGNKCFLQWLEGNNLYAEYNFRLNDIVIKREVK